MEAGSSEEISLVTALSRNLARTGPTLASSLVQRYRAFLFQRMAGKQR